VNREGAEVTSTEKHDVRHITQLSEQLA